VATASSSTTTAELTTEDMRAVIAVAGYRALWLVGPTLSRLANRIGWASPAQARAKLERLRRSGVIASNGGEGLLASREAVELALAMWRHIPHTAPPRGRRRRRPHWD
jgi:hypothetical protein